MNATKQRRDVIYAECCHGHRLTAQPWTDAKAIPQTCPVHAKGERCDQPLKWRTFR